MAGVINMPSTRCPYNGVMVGSSMCQLCKDFVSFDTQKNEVQCNHK